MPTEVVLPDCLLECYQFLYPTIDFSDLHIYDGIPYPWGLGPESAITLTWGFGMGIHIYLKSGQWGGPCGASDPGGELNGFDTFLVIGHELVHVLQIMDLPFRALWIAYYLKKFIASGFNWDCTNVLEREAYEHANGCIGPGGEGGDLRNCVETWDGELLPPCDCSRYPVLTSSMIPEGVGYVSFFNELQKQCYNLVKTSSNVPYNGSLGSMIISIIVDILALPTSSELGAVLATVGAVLGAVLGVIVGVALAGTVGLIILAVIVGLIVGAVVGALVLGLVGVIGSWIGSLFGGPSKKLLKVYVGDDGSGGLNLGGLETNSPPFVSSDGFGYLQGTDNTLWKVESTGGSRSKVGTYKTKSSPFVRDGFIYFQGTDSKLWKVGTDGSGGINLGGLKTKSTPFAASDGFVYFQNTDNTLWKVNSANGSGAQLGATKTSSAPFVGDDGFVYIRGTDNILWRVNSGDGSATEVGSGWKAKSTPFVPGDGFVYFQGADTKLWKAPAVGSGGVNLGGLKTNSAPFVGSDGFVYCQGTDNSLWKVNAADGSRRKITGFKTNSTPVAPGDGFAYFQSA